MPKLRQFLSFHISGRCGGQRAFSSSTPPAALLPGTSRSVGMLLTWQFVATKYAGGTQRKSQEKHCEGYEMLWRVRCRSQHSTVWPAQELHRALLQARAVVTKILGDGSFSAVPAEVVTAFIERCTRMWAGAWASVPNIVHSNRFSSDSNLQTWAGNDFFCTHCIPSKYAVAYTKKKSSHNRDQKMI